MSISQSVFFRFVGRLVLISYLHGVFYPIYAADQQATFTPPAKLKPLYGVKIEKVTTPNAPPKSLKFTFRDRSVAGTCLSQEFILTPGKLATLKLALSANTYLKNMTEQTDGTTGLWWTVGGTNLFVPWELGYSSLTQSTTQTGAPTLSLGVKIPLASLWVYKMQAKQLKLNGRYVRFDGDSTIQELSAHASSTHETSPSIQINEGKTLKADAAQFYAPWIANKGNVAVKGQAYLETNELKNDITKPFAAGTIIQQSYAPKQVTPPKNIDPNLPKIKPIHGIKVEKASETKENPKALKLTFKDRSNAHIVQKHAFTFAPGKLATLKQTLSASTYLQNMFEYTNEPTGLSWTVGGISVFINWDGSTFLNKMQAPVGKPPLSLGLKTFGKLYSYASQADMLKLTGQYVYLYENSNIKTLYLKATSKVGEEYAAVQIRDGSTLKTQALQLFARSTYNGGTVNITETAHLSTQLLNNDTIGTFTAESVTKAPDTITNKNSVHLKKIRGKAVITKIDNQTPTAKVTLEEPEDLTIEDLTNQGKTTFDKGKATINALVTTEGSTTSILASTTASLPSTFNNQGTFESASPLSFDWSKDNPKRGSIRLGNMHFTAPVTFNLRGWENENSILALRHFLRNQNLRFASTLKILADSLILTEDLTLTYFLDLDLTGNFAVNNALFKLKGLKVTTPGSIAFAEMVYRYVQGINKEVWSEIETEVDLILTAKSVDASHARGRAGGDIKIKGTERLKAGEKVSNGDNFRTVDGDRYRTYKLNKSYLYSQGKTIFKSPSMNLDHAFVKAFGGLSLNSTALIPAHGAVLLSGDETPITSPHLYLGAGFSCPHKWAVLAHPYFEIARYETQQTQKRNQPLLLTTRLISLGKFHPQVDKLTNQSSEIISADFYLAQAAYEEISLSGWQNGAGTGNNFFAPSLQTIEGTSMLDMKDTKLSSSQHSSGGAIKVTSTNGLTNINHAKTRETKDISNPVSLNITTFIQEQIDPTRTLSATGTVTPLLPAKRLYKDIMKLPSLGAFPTDIPVHDALIHMDVRDIALSCMEQIHETTGLQLHLAYLIDNAALLNKQVITATDLKALTQSIAYYTFEKMATRYQRILNLYIVPGDQNPFMSPGDMFANKNIDIVTENQHMQSARVVGKKGVNLEVTNGDLLLETTKHTNNWSDESGDHSVDVANPQMTVICLEDDVTLKASGPQGKGNINKIGTLVAAPEGEVDSHGTGKETEAPLILNESHTSTKKSSGLFSSSTTTVTNTSQKGLLPENISKTGQTFTGEKGVEHIGSQHKNAEGDIDFNREAKISGACPRDG